MVYGLVSAATATRARTSARDEFVIDRKRNNHMGFANGPHRCLGMHLARREMQIAVEEWLRVIPDFRLATDDELIERGGGAMMTLLELPLAWEVRVMKLRVDGATCMGHGRCYRLAPDLLTYDDEGYVTIRGQAIDVPAGPGRVRRGRRGHLPRAARSR